MQFSQVVKIEHLIIRVQERQKNVSSGWLKAQFAKDGNKLGHGELNRRKRNNGSWGREGRASQHYILGAGRFGSSDLKTLRADKTNTQNPEITQRPLQPLDVRARLWFGLLFTYISLSILLTFFSSPTHKILRRNSGGKCFPCIILSGLCWYSICNTNEVRTERTFLPLLAKDWN